MAVTQSGVAMPASTRMRSGVQPEAASPRSIGLSATRPGPLSFELLQSTLIELASSPAAGGATLRSTMTTNQRLDSRSRRTPVGRGMQMPRLYTRWLRQTKRSDGNQRTNRRTANDATDPKPWHELLPLLFRPQADNRSVAHTRRPLPENERRQKERAARALARTALSEIDQLLISTPASAEPPIHPSSQGCP